MNDIVKQQNAGQNNTGVQGAAGVPQQPISGPNKEAAPLSAQVGEYLKVAEVAPALPKEVAEVGVEHVANQERPYLPPAVKQVGVMHAKETIDHHTTPIGMVQLPTMMTKEQAVSKRDQGSVNDAARWLVAYVLRQFDKIAYQKLPTK